VNRSNETLSHLALHLIIIKHSPSQPNCTNLKRSEILVVLTCLQHIVTTISLKIVLSIQASPELNWLFLHMTSAV